MLKKYLTRSNIACAAVALFVFAFVIPKLALSGGASPASVRSTCGLGVPAGPCGCTYETCGNFACCTCTNNGYIYVCYGCPYQCSCCYYDPDDYGDDVYCYQCFIVVDR